MDDLAVARGGDAASQRLAFENDDLTPRHRQPAGNSQTDDTTTDDHAIEVENFPHATPPYRSTWPFFGLSRKAECCRTTFLKQARAECKPELKRVAILRIRSHALDS